MTHDPSDARDQEMVRPVKDALQSALLDAVWSAFQDTTVNVTNDINGFTVRVCGGFNL